MAVPDPHMSELRIIPYETMDRSCKSLYSIPRRNDFIKVLWCMDNLPGLPEEWCPAEVLHITSCHEQDCLATGVLLYITGHSWAEQLHKVEFLRNQKLRRAAEEDNEGSDDEDNGNPALDWTFSVDPAHDNTADVDKNWTPNMATNLEKSSDTLSRAHKRSKFSDGQEVEVTALRKGHATLIVEVQKLKRELVNLSHQVQDMRNSSLPNQSWTGAGCVLPLLRYKMALKLQAPVRTIHLNTGKRGYEESEQNVALRTGDGIHVGAMKARVECTLQQFESVARHVRETATPNSVQFFPDFSYTQLPLQCSSAFRILFKTFPQVADQLGFLSEGDRLEMTRKCGAGPQGDVLRILGTYHFSGKDASKPARIYLGSSCGEKDVTDSNAATVAVENEAVQLFPVLSRTNREWNNIDRRFHQELKFERRPLPKLTESASEVEAFALQWKRAPELGARTWSRSLTEPAQVFGWLDVTLPFIQTQGKYLCTEVGGMASDDVWNELLSK